MIVLSLGAGVQSSTIMHMARVGMLELDLAIFADLGAESPATYRYLDYLERKCPTPLLRLDVGNIIDDLTRAVRTGARVSTPPLHVKDLLYPDVRSGRLWRSCTRDYKVRPIHAEIRRQMRARGAKHAYSVLGISTDEAARMTDSRVSVITNSYPLIELGMSRTDCLEWLRRSRIPIPPKSSCVFCPFLSLSRWEHQRTQDPRAFALATSVDRLVRRGLPGVIGAAYVMRRCVPLDEWAQAREAGSEPEPPLDYDRAWNEECSGMCGV